jgi:hypothetical protein
MAGMQTATLLPSASTAPEPSGMRLAPWTPGSLEIHHISTGRGNAAFIICPDGTTLLIDAGAQYAAGDALHGDKYLISPKPDASRRPGEWIARYIKRRLDHCDNKEIDYFILTHLHTDHMGGIPQDPDQIQRSSLGNYVLTGVMDVNEQVRIRRILDRGYPDYSYPRPLNDPNQLNYRAFISSFVQRGGVVERFKPGSATQVSLRKGNNAFHFAVQNIVSNGVLWDGISEGTTAKFPPLAEIAPLDYPNENMCSNALCLSFGAFRYFAGGDLVHETHYGRLPWADIESPVAGVTGRVSVAAADHHGYVNGTGAEFVRQLRPRAFVISAWDSAHPTIPSLDNMLSRELYPGERDVYATALKPENIIATKRLAEIQSGNGHVIIRVPPDAKTFDVTITNNMDERDSILASFGPYPCSEA